MAAKTHLWWSPRDVEIWGGIIGLQNNVLNKELVEIFGAAYTPAAVTDKTKIHGVTEAWELPTTVGRGVQRHGTRIYNYTEERKVGDDLCGDTEVIGLWDPRRTRVFDIHIVDTYVESYDGRHPQKILSHCER